MWRLKIHCKQNNLEEKKFWKYFKGQSIVIIFFQWINCRNWVINKMIFSSKSIKFFILFSMEFIVIIQSHVESLKGQEFFDYFWLSQESSGEGEFRLGIFLRQNCFLSILKNLKIYRTHKISFFLKLNEWIMLYKNMWVEPVRVNMAIKKIVNGIEH